MTRSRRRNRENDDGAQETHRLPLWPGTMRAQRVLFLNGYAVCASILSGRLVRAGRNGGV